MKEKQLSACKIQGVCDLWTRQLWPVWALEKDIIRYANGGPAPGDDTAEEELVPLGFAHDYMRKEMAPLLDPLMNRPGIIDAKCVAPIIRSPERTRQVESSVNEELNRIVMSRMRSNLTAAAGRATAIGRAYLYRKSPNDWVIKSGRMLHPREAGTDILDSAFREWAFPDRLTLRDIDLILKHADKNRQGWSRDGLELLKKWILASEAQKWKSGNGYESGPAPFWASEYDPVVWSGLSLENTCTSDPVEVYWYFRKNGETTKDDPLFGGHEKVDLYCVSRFGGQSAVASELKGKAMEKELTITYKENYWETLEQDYRRKGGSSEEKDWKGNERLLYYQSDVFNSAEDCLVVHVDDAAISGEQRLGDVQGTGKTAMPKIAVMEAMFTSLVEGLTFAAQPNFTVQPGIGDEYMRQLQRGKFRSGQPFPPQVQPMAKQNAVTNFGPVMQFARMLDTSVASDSAAANSGNFGGSQQEFAAQAQAELANRASTAGRRLEGWLLTLDKVSSIIGRTLCRHWPEMKTSMPAYNDAARMRARLKGVYQIHEDEWDAERWDFTARRLAGGMMREQAKISALQGLQFISPIIPQSRLFFANEWLRATFGDTTAAQLMNPSEERTLTQEQEARNLCSASHVSGVASIPPPNSDPMIHSGVASKIAQDRIRAAMEAGNIAPAEVAGIMAIIGYMVANLQRLDPQMAEQAERIAAQMAKVLQSIPVQQPRREGDLTQKDILEAQIKERNITRLEGDSAAKQRMAEGKQLMDMARLNDARRMQDEQAKTLATQRASTIQDMSDNLLTADEPVDPFLSVEPA